jgi:hypothetical protein
MYDIANCLEVGCRSGASFWRLTPFRSPWGGGLDGDAGQVVRVVVSGWARVHRLAGGTPLARHHSGCRCYSQAVLEFVASTEVDLNRWSSYNLKPQRTGESKSRIFHWLAAEEKSSLRTRFKLPLLRLSREFISFDCAKLFHTGSRYRSMIDKKNTESRRPHYFTLT